MEVKIKWTRPKTIETSLCREEGTYRAVSGTHLPAPKQLPQGPCQAPGRAFWCASWRAELVGREELVEGKERRSEGHEAAWGLI